MVHYIYLIRHAKTQGNIERRYAGSSNESLNETGIRELSLKINSGYYPEADKVYISPMKRCRETAERIYPGQPLEITPGFAEYNFGEFEGKTYEELKDNLQYQKWIQSTGKDKAPGGEDMSSYKDRCCKAFQGVIKDILEKGIGSAALIIHGGTIMAVLEKYVLGEKEFYDWQIPNCEGYKIVIAEEPWMKHRILESVEYL